MSAPERERTPLEIAKGYLANTQRIGELERESEDAALQLAIAGGSGKIQAAHAEMARTFALVSIAESLATIVELLA